MILCDRQLKELGDSIITPFVDHKVATDEYGDRILSYGLSSFGYDIRVCNEWELYNGNKLVVIDPKRYGEGHYEKITSDCLVIPPNGFALGLSVEAISVPKDCHVLCFGKSTYARCGVLVNITCIEAGWSGRLVIEFSNTSPSPVKIYANEGCMQLIFLRGELPEKDYTALGGKYMNQTQIEVKV